jgi:hypothetical protein
MSARNGAGVTHQSDADARGTDQLGGKVSFVATPERKPFQVIRAELVGDDSCTALGVTAHGPSPVLAICSRLVAAGINPTLPHAYRSNVLALTVAAIGQAAQFQTNSKGTGFIRRRQAVRIGPPVAPTAKCLVQPHKQAVLAAREGLAFFTPAAYRRSS